MTRLAILFALVAAPLSAQSLIFPSVLDRHVPHLFSKPVVALGVTEGLKQIGVPKWLAVTGGLVGPIVFSAIRTEALYPGTIGTSAFWKDKAADTIAAATVVLPLNLKGPARGLTFTAGLMVMGGGLHRWSRP